MARGASVERREGFLLVDLAGEPYQLGLDHGHALRDEIGSLWEACQRLILNARGPRLGWVTHRALLAVARLMELYVPAALRRELRGVADGSGLAYGNLLLLNCFDDLMNNCRVFDRIAAQFACSAFAAVGARAADGTAIGGRNLDYFFRSEFAATGLEPTSVLQQHVVVFRYRPARGQPFVSVGWPGIVGVVTGQNAAGLMLSCLTSPAWSERPWGTPLPLLYRSVVQQAMSLAAAESQLRRARRTIGNNLVLAAAAERDARLVELSARQVCVSPPLADLVVATNHYHSPALGREQAALINPTSPLRLARARALLEAGPLDVARAQAILADEHCLDPAAAAWARICNAGTIYSTVFEPGAGRIWVRAFDRPDRSFVPVSLGAGSATAGSPLAASASE